MPTYNATEAHEVIDDLQYRAAGAPITYAWTGAILLMLAIGVWRYFEGEIMIAFFAAIPGGLIGFRLGQVRALSLRTQAQSLLCQMKIEENTRN